VRDNRTLQELLAPGAKILGAEDYRKTAILVPLYPEEGGQIIVTKRAEGIPQGSELCFPGGKYDPAMDKNLKETALRETEEEIGILQESYSDVISLGYYLAPFRLIIDCYIGLLETRPELVLNPAEVAVAFPLSVQKLLAATPQRYELGMEIHPRVTTPQGKVVQNFPAKELGLAERYHQSWKGPQYSVHHFPTPHGPLWGLSAEILRNFLIWAQENQV
jgi:coenzyme A diphosphatase NUDT7